LQYTHTLCVDAVAILHQVNLCAILARDVDNNSCFPVTEINHIKQIGKELATEGRFSTAKMWSVGRGVIQALEPNRDKFGLRMRPDQRIVTKLPLSELWDKTGALHSERSGMGSIR